jgi:hypothetical protein
MDIIMKKIVKYYQTMVQYDLKEEFAWIIYKNDFYLLIFIYILFLKYLRK